MYMYTQIRLLLKEEVKGGAVWSGSTLFALPAALWETDREQHFLTKGPLVLYRTPEC